MDTTDLPLKAPKRRLPPEPSVRGRAKTPVATQPFLDTGMREAAEQACSLMKVLANPDRLLILCQLSQGELRVGELEERLGIVQPTLSQQLGVLRRQGLLRSIACLDPREKLSPGQAEELTRVAKAYPELTDDAFVAANRDKWLA